MSLNVISENENLEKNFRIYSKHDHEVKEFGTFEVNMKLLRITFKPNEHNGSEHRFK